MKLNTLNLTVARPLEGFGRPRTREQALRRLCCVISQPARVVRGRGSRRSGAGADEHGACAALRLLVAARYAPLLERRCCGR